MYAILKLHQLAPRTNYRILVNPSLELLKELLPLDGAEWAIDVETNGTDAADPETRIVGIGLANDRHILYIDLATLGMKQKIYLIRFLYESQFVAFNLFFDGAFLHKLVGCWLQFTGDAYALFKNLANEGWNGQRWSLGILQRTVLGWIETNKTAIEEILKQRGLTKADLWKLEPEVLGPYCCADADSTWQAIKVLRETARTLYDQSAAN